MTHQKIKHPKILDRIVEAYQIRLEEGLELSKLPEIIQSELSTDKKNQLLKFMKIAVKESNLETNHSLNMVFACKLFAAIIIWEYARTENAMDMINDKKMNVSTWKKIVSTSETPKDEINKLFDYWFD